MSPLAVLVALVLAVPALLLLPWAPAEPAGWRWVVVAGSAAGAYACVPETDQYLQLMLAIVIAEAVEAFGVAIVPGSLHALAWGLLAWAAVYGATGRASAYIGGIFTLVAPLAAAWVARKGGGWLGLVVGLVWATAGVVVARTGGIATEARPAWVSAAIGVVAATAVSAVLWRRWPRAACAG